MKAKRIHMVKSSGSELITISYMNVEGRSRVTWRSMATYMGRTKNAPMNRPKANA